MIPICMVYEKLSHKKGSVIKHQHQYKIKIQNIQLQYNRIRNIQRKNRKKIERSIETYNKIE